MPRRGAPFRHAEPSPTAPNDSWMLPSNKVATMTRPVQNDRTRALVYRAMLGSLVLPACATPSGRAAPSNEAPLPRLSDSPPVAGGNDGNTPVPGPQPAALAPSSPATSLPALVTLTRLCRHDGLLPADKSTTFAMRCLESGDCPELQVSGKSRSGKPRTAAHPRTDLPPLGPPPPKASEPSYYEPWCNLHKRLLPPNLSPGIRACQEQLGPCIDYLMLPRSEPIKRWDYAGVIIDTTGKPQVLVVVPRVSEETVDAIECIVRATRGREFLALPACGPKSVK
jgi:hypothetical protein